MTYQINGSKGIYDSSASNDAVKYGRNAVDNHLNHLEAPFANDNNAIPPVLDFSGSPEANDANITALEKYIDQNDAYLNSLPPLEYEYRYIPNFTQGKLNPDAVIGAAYEEMGGVKELSVKEFENRYLIDETQTAEPMDINKDGKIDVAEYGANIIATDILSKGTTDPMKADGVINTKGMNAILEYSKKSNATEAAKLYSNIYNTYSLGNSINQI